MQKSQRFANWTVVDDRELTSYGWIDRQRGIVRIPIDRAMELLANEGESEAAKPRTPPAD